MEPLKTVWPTHSPEEIDAVSDILRSGKTNYWTGREGQAFETEWSQLVGIPHALTCSNGTTALELCLRGIGFADTCAQLGSHDVLVPARTFMATAAAVVTCGGRPVLADIGADSLCVTPETLEAARTEKTAGVIVVHWAGLPCPRMDEIARWAMRHGLWIIEDCAHAHGAPVGRQSHAAAWSFCVGKIMSTGGEGGMVVTSDAGIAERMRGFRDHGKYQMTGRRDMNAGGGIEFEWTVSGFGSNMRMTEMQSVIGRIQLRGLAEQLKRRREIAARYDEVLGWRAMYTPEQRETHARYLYHVRTAGKRPVMQALKDRGIPAGWGGCHNIGHEEAFSRRGWSYSCPVADRVGNEVFSIPCYPTMTDEDVGRVCQALKEAV